MPISEAALDQVKAVVGEAKTAMDQAKATVDEAKAIAGQAKSVVYQTVATAVDNAKNAMDNAKSVKDQTVATAVGKAKNAVDQAKTVVDQALATAVDNAKNAMDNAESVMDQTVVTAVDNAKNAVDNAKAVVDKAVATAVDKAKNAEDNAKKAAGKATHAVGAAKVTVIEGLGADTALMGKAKATKMVEAHKDIYLYITTQLDGDLRKFWLEDIEGEEHISGLFHYRLRLTSDDAEPVDFKKILGKPVTVNVELHEGGKRYINGIVTQFIQAESGKIHTTYYADIRPWLWQCTLTTDCRIFQNQNVPDIISAVFKGLGFTDFKINLKKAYNKRVYCVQYNETAFNFVSRLMEEEGIFYFFEHTDKLSMLILADDADAVMPCMDKAELRPVEPDHESENLLSDCTIEEQLVPNKYASRDYNFETPNTRVMSSVDAKETGKFRVYTYPGGYGTSGDGDTVSDKRIESYELPSKLLRGQGFCRAFTAGYKFTLAGHERADFNVPYVLSNLFVHATPERYFNHFEAFPADVPYRPLRITPKPRIYSSQTAVVVGKAGEEIWTDKYGRVKVQFHWDELGKKDENSSCWVRVTQMWAGKNWGTMFIPRIGAEVIVSFLEGDPDQPIISGTVYNASQTVPYPLPAEKTKSTMKSDSSLGGGGFNEIRFEDKKGQEEIFTHAQKDQNEVVENNMSTTVKANQSISVGGNRSKSVTGNQTDSIDGTHKQTIKKDTTIIITEGTYSHEVATGTAKYVVKGDLTEQYQANQNTTVASDIIITSEKSKINIIAATEIKLEVGASSLSMKSDGTIEIGGVTINIKGSASVNVDGLNINLNGGNINSTAQNAHNINGANVSSVAAGQNIILGGIIRMNF